MASKLKYFLFGFFNIESICVWIAGAIYLLSKDILPTNLFNQLPFELMGALFGSSVLLFCLIWKNYYDIFTTFKTSNPEIFSLEVFEKIFNLHIGSLVLLTFNLGFNLYSLLQFFNNDKTFAFFFNFSQIICLAICYVITRLNIAKYHAILTHNKLITDKIPDA